VTKAVTAYAESSSVGKSRIKHSSVQNAMTPLSATGLGEAHARYGANGLELEMTGAKTLDLDVVVGDEATTEVL
jgi:hypothetical protein